MHICTPYSSSNIVVVVTPNQISQDDYNIIHFIGHFYKSAEEIKEDKNRCRLETKTKTALRHLLVRCVFLKTSCLLW